MPKKELECYNFNAERSRLRNLTEAAEDLLNKGEHFSAHKLWQHAGYKGGAKDDVDQETLNYANHQSELSFLRKINRHEKEIKQIGKESKDINKAVAKVRNLIGFSYLPFIAKCKIEFLIIDANPEISIE